MNSRISSLVLLAAALISSLCVLRGAAALDVTTNAAVRHQTIEGWGTSGGSASSMTGNAWRTAYRDLGLNVYRVQLSHQALTPARTDYNNNGVLESSEADYRVRIPLIGNSLAENAAKFDFALDAGETRSGNFSNWLSNNALEPDRVKIVGSLWTPPHWMKGPTGFSQDFVGVTDDYPTPWMAREHWNNGGVPKGQGDSIGGRLRTEDPTNLAEYGLYVASHVKAFEQAFGVDLHAISLQNESTFENPFISMVLNRGPKPANGNSPEDYGQYNLALKSVRNAWQQYGLDAKIKGPHMALNQMTPENPWALLAQMRYVNSIRNDADPTLIDFLDYYNSNYYSGAHEAGAKSTAGYYQGINAVPANWASWLSPNVANGVQQNGKPIWFSETGYEGNTWLQSAGNPGSGAINVAALMFNALVHADASAYIYWQFTDGNNGNATQYSLVGANQLSNPSQSAKYASFKHFSRYVRPDAVRIDATFNDGFASTGGASQYDTTNSVNVSAFLHEEDQTLTYVLLNLKASTEAITLHLPSEFDVVQFEAFRTTETERFLQLPDMIVADGQVSFTMPQFSLLTLVGDMTTPILPGDFNSDGVVDGLDLAQWQGDFGVNGDSDADLDGDSDGADFLTWQRALGAGIASNESAAAVPEAPCEALALAGLAMISSALPRRLSRNCWHE